MRRWPTLLVSLGLVPALLACSGGAPPSPEGGDGPQPVVLEVGVPVGEATSGLAEPDEPMMLRATSGEVTFELTIPPGSVSVPVTVSMSPLAEISGFGDAAAVVGVELQPAGLTLATPATLRLTGAPVNGDGQWRAWSFENPAATVPAFVADESEPTLLIDHFSGFGVTSQAPDGWREEVVAQRVEVDNVVDLLQFEVAFIQQEHAQGVTNDAEYDAALQDAIDRMDEWTARLVDTAAAVAASGDIGDLDGLYRDLQRRLAFERQLELMGRPVASRVADMAERVLKVLQRRFLTLCEQHHDLSGLTMIVTIQRQLDLLGLADAPLDQLLSQCLRVEIRIKARWTETLPRDYPSPFVAGQRQTFTWGAILEATLPLSEPVETDVQPQLKQSKSLPCAVSLAPGVTTVRVDEASWIGNVTAVERKEDDTWGAQLFRIQDVRMAFNPGVLLADHCGAMRDRMNLYAWSHRDLARGAMDPGAFDPTRRWVVIDGGWTIPEMPGPVLARIEFDRALSGPPDSWLLGDLEAHTEIEIVHTPGG